MSMNDKGTILVVDNDEDFTRALKTRLNSLRFHCITARSGTEGLAKFCGEHVDLVVSDLNMADGDGVEFAEKIRWTSNVPIIFVTGFRDDFRRQLRHIQNVTTLRKPFPSQDLIDLIPAFRGDHPTSTSPANTDSESQ